MSRRAIRIWYLVHKWTSLVCTIFLLMLCVTGLPLIFHEEIDELTGAHGQLAEMPADTPLLSLDTLLANARASRPGEVGLFVSFDEDRPVVNITTGPTPDAAEADMTIRSYDMRTGAQVGVIGGGGFTDFMLTLHKDMFLGMPGMLFLGFMGFLFVIALISGVVLYAPFMRKLDFGTLRVTRSKRLKWIDTHNLIGITAFAWMFVVGVTGVINTLSEQITQVWRDGQLAEMTSHYAGRDVPSPDRMASLQAAVETAQRAAPGMRVQFVGFPGGLYSSGHHYAVFMQGDTPLTKRLLTPALIDARTGQLTDMRPMPWSIYALFVSQPLHFGDYGGLPLKILWAILTLFTIVVLISGLYLWLGRRRAPLAARVGEVETGGLAAPEPAE